MYRGAVAEIRLDAVSRNLRTVRRLTGNRPVIAVVKADAYGHGAVEVAGRLAGEGVTFLAVAFSGEAIELREAGIRTPILVLFDRYGIRDFFEYDLTPVVHDLFTARELSRVAVKRRQSLDVHVKIDTGMGRLGFNSGDVLKEIAAIGKMSGLRITGLMSHFSDSDISDTTFAREQLKNFHAIRESLMRKQGLRLLCHMANSGATVSLRDAHLDGVRPGLILYGHSPFQRPAASGGSSKPGVRQNAESGTAKLNLVPAMAVKTRILSLRRVPKGAPVSYGRTFITRRNSVIAVLPVGYADGYNRKLSNAAEVLVKGKRAPVAGRVCMDLVMVDVTGVKGVRENDEVVLLGRQGREEITASEIGEKAGTISYEVLTSLGSRSKRIYV